MGTKRRTLFGKVRSIGLIREAIIRAATGIKHYFYTDNINFPFSINNDFTADSFTLLLEIRAMKLNPC